MEVNTQNLKNPSRVFGMDLLNANEYNYLGLQNSDFCVVLPKFCVVLRYKHCFIAELRGIKAELSGI